MFPGVLVADTAARSGALPPGTRRWLLAQSQHVSLSSRHDRSSLACGMKPFASLN